jgi:hypothetical protein
LLKESLDGCPILTFSIAMALVLLFSYSHDADYSRLIVAAASPPNPLTIIIARKRGVDPVSFSCSVCGDHIHMRSQEKWLQRRVCSLPVIDKCIGRNLGAL